MKKYILMMLVVLLPISSSLAQTHKDSIDTYNELKEWAVIKLTIAYIEDLRPQYVNETDVNEIEGKNQKGFKVYYSIEEKYHSYTIQPVDFKSLEDDLIKGELKSAVKALNNYKKVLVDDNSKFDFINIGYSPKTSGESRAPTLREIQDKYSEILDNSTISEENEKLEKTNRGSNSYDDVNEPDIYKESRIGNRSSNIMIYFYIVLGLLIVSIVVNFLQFSRSKNKKENLQKSKYSGKINKMTSKDIEIGKLKQRIKGLEKNNEQPKPQIKINKPPTQTTVSPREELPSKVVELDIPIPAHTNRIIYLASPFQDSTFADEDASNVKTLNTIYQVDFNEKTNTGVLSLIQDADFSKALNSPDSYLETACIYDNEYNNNSREIRVSEKGEIRLEGEDWIVSKKVRIKFI